MKIYQAGHVKIINKVPPVASKGIFATLDLEMFHMVSGKLHRPIGDFACLSICMDGKDVYQIYDEKQIKSALKNLNKATWIFHNALFDLRQLMRYTEIRPRFIWDTMLVDQSTCGGLYQNFALDDLARRYLKVVMDKTTRKEFETRDSMTPKMKSYAANDALVTWKIANIQEEKYSGSPYFKSYTEVDEPAIWPILDMPGIAVDKEGWAVMVEGFKKKVDELQTALGINVMSGAQVMKEASKHGVHITNTQAETLKAFKDVPFIAGIMEARTYRKAVSSYGMKWLEEWVEADGKIYCSYNITRAETGRMSANNPPMQTIPQRKLPEYRARFIPSKGNVILVADVSQQEPRILTYESKDEALLEALKSKEDLHLTVARAVFNDDKIVRDDPRRDIGKTINLGTSYGLSEYGLSARLGITEQEAAKFLKNYFTRFRGVFTWISLQRNYALRNGFVKTAIGRRIFINPYNNQWSNNAINAPIQGGAADFTKVWVRKIWELCDDAVPFFIVALVHDEIVCDVPRSQVKAAKHIIDTAFFQTAETLYPGIPFAYDLEMGKSWGCKRIKSELEDEDAEI